MLHSVEYTMVYNMLYTLLYGILCGMLHTIVYNMLYNMLAQAELPGACQEIQEWSCRVERFNPASSTPPGLCSRGRGSLHALATNAGY